MDVHFGGMFGAEHEFQKPAGQMQEATGFAAPQHLHFHPRPHTHRLQPTLQAGMARQGGDRNSGARWNLTEWHGQPSVGLHPRSAHDGTPAAAKR